jgi:hypothetical protein
MELQPSPLVKTGQAKILPLEKYPKDINSNSSTHTPQFTFKRSPFVARDKKRLTEYRPKRGKKEKKWKYEAHYFCFCKCISLLGYDVLKCNRFLLLTLALHTLIPLLLLAAEGKCEIQLLLQYSPEMWKGFLNPIIFIWEFEFKCPQQVRRATEGKEEGK